jgi:hypothetical protein
LFTDTSSKYFEEGNFLTKDEVNDLIRVVKERVKESKEVPSIGR